MEGTDPFAGGVEAPTDDPFADKPDEGSFAQDDPFAEAGDQPSAEPVPGVPVVDAEGNEVPPAEAATQVAAAEEASSAASSDQSDDPGVAAEVPPVEAGASAPAASGDGASSEAPGEAAGHEAEGPTSLSTSADDGASSNGDGTPAGHEAEEAPDEEAQERANETENGKVVKRAYRLFSPDGSGKWREVTWYEDKDGKLAEKGAPGARKQNTCVVRGQAEALRIGWRAMGQPQEGCKLVAVSANNFRVRHVGPEAKPEPRVKLAIS